jgi:hypothetical protein
MQRTWTFGCPFADADACEEYRNEAQVNNIPLCNLFRQRERYDHIVSNIWDDIVLI